MRYGEQHEQAILEAFERDGRTVERIQTGRTEEELRRAVAQTTEAMRRGVEVIHQAALVGDGIGGYADFLERIDRPSDAGRLELRRRPTPSWPASTKTYFLVQLSAYAALIERLQGHPPERAGGAARRRPARQLPQRRLRRLRAGAAAATPSRRSARAWRTPTRCPAATAASAATAAPASSDGWTTTTCRWWPAFAATRSPGWRQPASPR